MPLQPLHTKYLPQEFVASQELSVHYQGKYYRIWGSIKRNPLENTEARGKPLVVTCELSAEERSIVVNRVPIHTLCVWDVEPDPKTDWEKEEFFDKE